MHLPHPYYRFKQYLLGPAINFKIVQISSVKVVTNIPILENKTETQRKEITGL